jgi:hypothetical protein
MMADFDQERVEYSSGIKKAALLSSYAAHFSSVPTGDGVLCHAVTLTPGGI